MQRQPFAQPPPAQTPPLHHPVPQHVSTVPQFRSPPPPQGQAQNGGYGYTGGAQQPQQPQQAGVYGAPNFGGFMNDPTAQMGLQVGKTAFDAGQQMVEQNFNRYINMSALKHYFNVSNFYVANKVFLILFPWRHKPWARRQTMGPNGQEGFFMPPRDDINSPDMYIPVMAFVTYILLSALLAGLRGDFRPEVFGYTASTAIGIVIFEIIMLKLGCYLLSISNESQLLDLFAYSGYKFVGIIVTVTVAEIFNRGAGTGGLVGWLVFLYTFCALAFFLLRSMKYVLMPENNAASGAGVNPVARSQRNRRTHFLFGYSFIAQLVLMGFLTQQEAAKMPSR